MTCFNFWYFVMYRNKRKPKYMFCHAIDNDGQVGMVQISTLNLLQRHFKLKNLRCCTIWSNCKSQKGNSHIYKWKWLDALVHRRATNHTMPCKAIHSLIIIREVLILTLSIFIALKGCISWYSPASRMILNEMVVTDHILQYTPCSLGSILYPYTAERRDVLGNTFFEDQEISRGWGGLVREIAWDPRGEKFPLEGNLSVLGKVFPDASLLEAVYGHYNSDAWLSPRRHWESVKHKCSRKSSWC